METALTYWGFAIGVVGTILSIVGIYLTIKSNKKKEPVYSIKSINIISDYASKYNDLTVAYKGKKVKILRSARCFSIIEVLRSSINRI